MDEDIIRIALALGFSGLLLASSFSEETALDVILRIINSITFFVFMVLSMFQPTKAIFQDGVLYHGSYWSWNDIEQFEIFRNNIDRSLIPAVSFTEDFLTEIVFYTKKMPFWSPKQIFFHVPEQKLSFVSIFINQQLSGRNGRSAT